MLETHARLLLVVHALLGGTLVALTTHHLVWIIRSREARRPGEPRFALLASLFFVLTFLLGSLLYPTYRVRVRAELLDAPAAIAREVAARTDSAPSLSPPRIARLFDVKEHLVALGLLASLALYWLSRRTSPTDPASRFLYVGLAIFCCATTWCGVVIGLYTASIRAVGGFG
ncbi:MAG: hypothetical protein ABI445_01895 [Polyangia bacterium]